MARLEKILVPTDFSPVCELALQQAAALARRCGAELHVLHVQAVEIQQFAPLDVIDIPMVKRAIEAQSHQQMDEFLAGLDLPAVPAIGDAGAATPAILDYIERHGINLVVMGTHARKGLTRIFMGSVTAEVLRRAPVPLLAIGPDARHEAGAGHPVIAAVDFSEASLEALHQAAQLAQLHDTSVLAVHIVDTRTLPPYFTASNTEEQLTRARAELEQRIAAAELPVKIESMVAAGHPEDEIPVLAGSEEAALIVMGVAGLSRLDRLLVGSTTDRVLRQAVCPVWAHRGDRLEQL